MCVVLAPGGRARTPKPHAPPDADARGFRRHEAALEPGVPLDVRCRDGVVEIEPQPIAVTLKRKGRLLVAVPGTPVRPLRTATVERTY